MKIDFLINDEDRRTIEDFILELEKKEDLKIGDSIATGGLKVSFEEILCDDNHKHSKRIFTIDREIGQVVREIKEKRDSASRNYNEKKSICN